MATVSARPNTRESTCCSQSPESAAPCGHVSNNHAGIAPEGSAGSDLWNSRVLESAVDQIVGEVSRCAARLTGPRPALSAAATQSYEAFMHRCAQTRGRALLYPYVSTGVGHGALVELADGSVKWDMICGIGVHFFGHSDPGLVRAAVRSGAGDVLMHGNLQSGAEPYLFAERLLALAGRSSRLKHAYLATSGCMANENAIKVCYQKHAPASRVLAFKDCFMGRSVTMSQIGDAAANRVGIPLSTQVDYMPFYDPVEARRAGVARHIDAAASRLREFVERYPKQHACFIFELVQGEGGFNSAPREFFSVLMDMCKAHGIAIWDDEIQTFGRTRSMFAYEQLNIGEYVDVFCIGKMTQACATLFTQEYNPGPGLLSGTFTGSNQMFAVGCEVLDRLERGDYYGPKGRIARHHDHFVRCVRDLAAKHPAWFPQGEKYEDIVGGEGGMMRFTPFGGDKEAVMKACRCMFDEGVMVFYCGHGPYHVRMLPPLGVFEESNWVRVFECVERGLAKATAG